MNEHPHDELLHGAVDGTLTEAQAEHLREQLAADAALRERAAGLRRVNQMVNGLGPAEPPGGFVDRVMGAVAKGTAARPAWLRRCANRVAAGWDQLFNRRVRHLERDNGSGDGLRWTTGMAGGGANVAKKTLWAVAGLAVATILVVVYYNGTRSVDQGAEGTIGAADRYRGAQPTSVAAKEGNAQKFLQSDTFDKLLKDKNVRALMADKDMCALLASPEVQAALGKPDVQKALQDESVEAALKGPKFQLALQDEAMAAAMHSANLHAAMQDATVEAALKATSLQVALADQDVQAELRKKSVRLALADAEAMQAALKTRPKAGAVDYFLASGGDVAAALKIPAFKAMLADPSFEAALRGSNGRFAALLADDAFDAALKSSGQGSGDPKARLKAGNALDAALRGDGSVRFLKLLTDDGIQAAFKNENFRALMADDTFAAALRRPLFDVFLANPDAQAALRRPLFDVFLKDADAQAALRDSGAMEAALRRAGPIK